MSEGKMTYQTPHDEIVRRYNDESVRAFRWSLKHQNKLNPTYEKFENAESMLKYISGKSKWKLVGYVPWTSPKNGDTWISVCLEAVEEKEFTYNKWMINIPAYYWETVGGYGIMFWSKIPTYDANDGCGDTESIWVYTSHCIRRLKERLGVEADVKTMLLFLYCMNEYSIAYNYKRCGKQTLEIANQFGVFRTNYTDGTKTDPIRTFISKEQLNDIDRKRYEKKWAEACKHLFKN